MTSSCRHYRIQFNRVQTRRAKKSACVCIYLSLRHCLRNQIGIFWSLPDGRTDGQTEGRTDRMAQGEAGSPSRWRFILLIGIWPPLVMPLSLEVEERLEVVGVDYVDGQHVLRIYTWRCHRPIGHRREAQGGREASVGKFARWNIIWILLEMKRIISKEPDRALN